MVTRGDAVELECTNMPCLTPIRIPNPYVNSKSEHYETAWKNASKYKRQKILSSPQSLYLEVPCGKCFGCMRMRCEGWVFRHLLELKQCTSATFVTLTYNDESLPITKNGQMCFSKKHVQNYIKRIRIWLTRNGYEDIKIKYHIASEYGDTFDRSHYHILLYNWPFGELDRLAQQWPYGTCHVGDINVKSIRYVVEYITQFYYNIEFDEECKPFSMYSKNIGDTLHQDVAKYMLATKQRVYVIDGDYYRVPRSYQQYLVNNGYLSEEDSFFLSRCAQKYYNEINEIQNDIILSDGLTPEDVRRDYIRAKKIQEERKYQLRKKGINIY